MADVAPPHPSLTLYVRRTIRAFQTFRVYVSSPVQHGVNCGETTWYFRRVYSVGSQDRQQEAESLLTESAKRCMYSYY